MELRRLRYFLRIAGEGSLGKASRSLGIAQPALGRQIQLLESELGVRLFHRVARGMVLTDEGEYLKEALEHPLQQIDLALQNVRSPSTRVEVSLTLGLPPNLARLLGPGLMRRMGRDLPNLKLRIAEGSAINLAADVSRSLVDIALIVDTTPSIRTFRSEILTEQLMLVGLPGTLPARRESLGVKDLEGLPLILPGPQASLRSKLTKAAASAEAAIRVALEVDYASLAKLAVLDGTGFAVLAPLDFREEAQLGTLAGLPIEGLVQTLQWVVQPHWRVGRNTYNAVEHVVFEEMYAAVTSGEWPADWKMPVADLSLPLGLDRAVRLRDMIGS